MNFFLEKQIKNLNLYNNLRTPCPQLLTILMTSLSSYPHYSSSSCNERTPGSTRPPGPKKRRKAISQ